MPIITHSSGVAPASSLISSGVIGNNISTVLASTQTIFSYLTTGSSGNIFTFEGTFTYPSGNNGLPVGSLNKLTIDFDGDGSIDYTFDYGTSPIDVTPGMFSNAATTFYAALLGQSNTINYYSETQNFGPGWGVGANGTDASLTDAFSDIINIEGTGVYAGDHLRSILRDYQSASDVISVLSDDGDVVAIGDVYQIQALFGPVNATIILADDTMTDNSDASASNSLFGDAVQTGLGNFSDVSIEAGDDMITSNAFNEVAIFGDVGTILGNGVSIQGGNDTITVTEGIARIYADFFDVVSTSTSTVHGGDDIVTGTGAAPMFVWGDATNVSGAFHNVFGGDDTITGGAGADFLVGDIGRVTSISTMGGQFNLATGDDTISGGLGDDTIIGDIRTISRTSYFDVGDDTLNGGGGDDLIYGDYREINTALVTYAGTGVDTINGDDGDDVIFGQYGNDLLYGGADNDTINGGAGDDLIDGGSGLDIVDYSDVGVGITLALVPSGDLIVTFDGTDTLRSIEGIIGTDFADTLTGTAVANILIGGDGNDTLNAGSGDDILEGGLGDDTLDGGAGLDTVVYRDLGLGVGVIVDLNVNGQAQDTNGAGMDTLFSIENVTGTDFDDILYGSNDTNILHGGGGDDTILMRSGLSGFGTPGNNNQVFGEAGDDIMGFSLAGVAQSNVGSGQLFDGGDDVDTFVFETFGNGYQADLDDGVFFRIDTGAEIATLTNIENINAGSGNDRLVGNEADNILSGNDGDDYFFGQQGNDSLYGGAGNDTADFSSNFSGVIADLMEGAAVGTAQGSDKLFSIENIIGSNRDDEIYGDNFDNVLSGADGYDLLVGFDGNDTLDGGSGNDELFGEDGDDTLTGGGGADVLDGGGGDDVIYADREDFISGPDNVNGGTGFDTLIVTTNTVNYFKVGFSEGRFETGSVMHNNGNILQSFTRLPGGDGQTFAYDPFGLFDWSYAEIRDDVTNTKSYTTLSLFFSDTNDALDTVVNVQDNGRRVTTDYDPNNDEAYNVSIFTEDLADEGLWESVLDLRNDNNERYNLINVYDDGLRVDIEFDVENDDPYFRKVTNIDNSPSQLLLNYQTAVFYQTANIETYQLDVLGDNDVRSITDFDIDNLEVWATERTRTDDGDNFTWGTIIEQRMANGDALFVSQTNEGSYDTTDEYDLLGQEVWARRTVYIDDEDLYSWDTITFLYDDSGVVYDTTTVPDA